MLKFAFGNRKLNKGQIIFDLPAGHSCPFARECKAMAMPDGSGLVQGPHTRFRCYAATAELVFKWTRLNRWANFDTLKGRTRKEMYDIISFNLPFGLLYRIHSSGDFFSQAYFDAWLDVARAFPERTFYAYTKALPFWIKRMGTIPANFKLVASYGGTHDKLIQKHKLKYAIVVNWEHEAEAMGLEIDTDDSHAWQGDRSFALLIHATQPPNTPESRAWQYHKTNKKGKH
jgi:hypothetical protein